MIKAKRNAFRMLTIVIVIALMAAFGGISALAANRVVGSQNNFSSKDANATDTKGSGTGLNLGSQQNAASNSETSKPPDSNSNTRITPPANGAGGSSTTDVNTRTGTSQTSTWSQNAPGAQPSLTPPSGTNHSIAPSTANNGATGSAGSGGSPMQFTPQLLNQAQILPGLASLTPVKSDTPALDNKTQSPGLNVAFANPASGAGSPAGQTSTQSKIQLPGFVTTPFNTDITSPSFTRPTPYNPTENPPIIAPLSYEPNDSFNSGETTGQSTSITSNIGFSGFAWGTASPGKNSSVATDIKLFSEPNAPVSGGGGGGGSSLMLTSMTIPSFSFPHSSTQGHNTPPQSRAFSITTDNEDGTKTTTSNSFSWSTSNGSHIGDRAPSSGISFGFGSSHVTPQTAADRETTTFGMFGYGDHRTPFTLFTSATGNQFSGIGIFEGFAGEEIRGRTGTQDGRPVMQGYYGDTPFMMISDTRNGQTVSEGLFGSTPFTALSEIHGRFVSTHGLFGNVPFVAETEIATD